ncbi:DNA ligase D [Pseudogracilibacillus auburnensis]|uniref:DNA ligase D n=1 Tax=Pseudogracilibacillus auburnensis TaxID=1494959 RepID=UPI001A96568E|nr:DNA ligase D [Pseudogracilibacillus auburnensis]MBO1002579.1 DNA ligase D [Pseudogracilibacillus auburnensis]
MNLMQPIVITDLHQDDVFLYEVKYDGFRAVVHWTDKKIGIISRNNKELTENFPEIIQYCESIQSQVKSFLPMQLEGELVVLNNKFQANFALIQKRGRLKTKEKIAEIAKERPATFIVFDLLQIEGKELTERPLLERKEQLHKLFAKINQETGKLQMINILNDFETISKLVFDYKAEGIVAKRKAATYSQGKNHHDWLKWKNWRTIQVFLTEFYPKNDYFTAAVYEKETIIPIGKCKHGLDDEEYESLKQIFMTNGEKNGQNYTLPPAICTKIHTLDLHTHELREPEFAQLAPELSPTECTVEKLQLDLAMLPDVGLSNEDKLFWPQIGLTKGDLLTFMRDIYPYMIPYLSKRALTVIRCPDGIAEESFFQKNLPSYAPDFVEFIETEDKRIQLCNNLPALIWYANHSAIEYHIPFQPFDSSEPTEIVFDLDPASREDFSLAIKASLMIKQLLNEFELTSFIKTSGNKGLQIHIPLKAHAMNYEQTAIFTEAIAKTVEKAGPNLFTTERFKKNRGEKLYIDYVQHGKNRTIVAPYSPRKTEEATVATPLYWEEVKEDLHPTRFTIKNVVERVQTFGCPWLKSYELARNQKLDKVLAFIQTG